MDWLIDKQIRTDRLLFYACAGAFFSLPLSITSATVFGILATLVWLCSGKAYHQRYIYIQHSWSWPVLLLMILPWIGLLYSPDTTGLGVKYAKKTHYWVYGLAVAAIAFKRFQSEQLVQAFLAGLAVNSITAMFQLGIIFIQGDPLGFDLGVGSGYSSMSAFLVLGIMVSAFYFNEVKDNRRRFYLCLLMGLFFIHLIMMKGRNGYFTFIVLSPFIVVKLIERINVFKVLLIYSLIIGLAALSPAVKDRVSFTVKEINAHINAPVEARWRKNLIDVEARLWMYVCAYRAFKQHPVFGVGTGGFKTFVEQNGEPDWPLLRHPHNSFLYMAVSFGIVGVLALTWFFWELLKNSWFQRKTVAGYFVFSSALVIFVSGIFNSQILNAETAFLLAVTAGLQQGFPQFSIQGPMEKEQRLFKSKP
ncbi:MAG: O-antigen ligase family protein [Desulfobacterales bacterium]|nr:MAG: O-antigen ligase family protein [Desulfobacterales bacterium]